MLTQYKLYDKVSFLNYSVNFDGKSTGELAWLSHFCSILKIMQKIPKHQQFIKIQKRLPKVDAT